MKKRHPFEALLLLAALFLAAVPAPASAAGGGISLSASVVPIGSGDAGSGFGAPEYNDAFDTGWGARIEPYFDFTPMIRGQFGVAYNRWDGKTFFGETFSDLKMTAYYVGVKVRFLRNRSVRPYVVADIGAARLSSVSNTGLHGGGVTTPYWGATTTAFLDIGGGVEFHVSPQIAFFLDIRAQGTGEPDSLDSPFSDADGVGSVPISAGVNISF